MRKIILSSVLCFILVITCSCGKLKFSKSTYICNYADTKYTIPCTNASNYSSSDERVFVIENNKIKTVGGGMATLTAVSGSKTAQMRVIVTGITVKNIKYTVGEAIRYDRNVKISTTTKAVIGIKVTIENLGNVSVEDIFRTDNCTFFTIKDNENVVNSLCCRVEDNIDNDGENTQSVISIQGGESKEIIVLFALDDLTSDIASGKKYFEVGCANHGIKIGGTKVD